jgi:hypothetical protein
MGEPTMPAEQEDRGSLFKSLEESKHPELAPQYPDDSGTSSVKACTDGSSGHFKLIEHSQGEYSSQDILSTSQPHEVNLSRPLEHCEAQATAKSNGQSARFSELDHVEDGLSRPTNRTFHDEETQNSQQKVQKVVYDQPTQPLESIEARAENAVRSRQEQILHKYQTLGFTNGTYKREQHVTRNQYVLGLKYIHDRYGNPRRSVLCPNKPPNYIDKVFGYHDFAIATTGPPPGLETQQGQFTPAGKATKSMLPQFRHDRLRHYTMG